MHDTSRRSALVVEDDPDFCQILRHLLEPWSLDVETADSGSRALERMTKRSFDLYLVDLQLSDGDAGAVFARLVDLGGTTLSRCVVVTGFPRVAPIFTDLPIVSKTQLSAVGEHLVRVLGVPVDATA